MKKLLLFMITFVLSYNLIAQTFTKDEIQLARKLVKTSVETELNDYRELFTVKVSFNDRIDAMVVTINSKYELDYNAKRFYDIVVDSWSYRDKELIVKTLDITKLKVTIKTPTSKSEYIDKIIKYTY